MRLLLSLSSENLVRAHMCMDHEMKYLSDRSYNIGGQKREAFFRFLRNTIGRLKRFRKVPGNKS